MGERLALMVRPGRRMAPRPAGAIFLIGELAEGLTCKDLDRALELYRMACAGGHPPSCRQADKLD